MRSSRRPTCCGQDWRASARRDSSTTIGGSTAAISPGAAARLIRRSKGSPSRLYLRSRMIASMIRIMLLCALAPASQPALENLGQPCRAFNVLAGRDVIDPSGKEWLVLTNMNEISGCELIFVDFKNNTGQVYHAPAGQGSWA